MALSQPNLATILETWRPQYDFLLVDSCPVLPVADSLLIGQHVDAVLFAVLRGVSQLPKIYAAYQRLAMLRIPLLGAVVNGAEQEAYGYGYSQYLGQR
jgi:Mrp family chromosome partitioning ATPase